MRALTSGAPLTIDRLWHGWRFIKSVLNENKCTATDAALSWWLANRLHPVGCPLSGASSTFIPSQSSRILRAVAAACPWRAKTE